MKKAIYSFIFILTVTPVCETCFGLGGCGFGGPCCFAPVLGCGCMRYCARAKASRTLRLGKSNQLIKTSGKYSDYDDQDYGSQYRAYSSPDEEFFECCKERGLPSSCLDKCSYSSYSGDSLRNMFLRMDECPVRAANDLHMCATRGRDHRACCARHGVASTLAGQKCLLFCTKPPDNQTELDLSYLPCYDQFDAMRTCFWKDAMQDYEMRMDPKAAYRAMLTRYTEF